MKYISLIITLLYIIFCNANGCEQGMNCIEDNSNIRYRSFGHRPYTSINIKDSVLANSILDGISTRHLTFTNVIMENSSFAMSELPQVRFRDSTFSNIDFTESNFIKGSFSGSVFLNCNFSGTNLKHVDLHSSQMTNSLLVGAIYNSKTKLPFSTHVAHEKGMIYVP